MSWPTQSLRSSPSPESAMAASESASPRWQPFSLISATTFRFVLLVVTAVATVASVAGWVLPVAFGQTDVAAINANNSCVIRSLQASANAWRTSRDPAVFAGDAGCTAPGQFWGWPLIGLVLFCAGTLSVMWWLPEWRVRRRRLEPVGGIPGRSPRPPEGGERA